MNVDLDALAHEFNMDVDTTLGDAAVEIDLESLNAEEPSNPDITLANNIGKANAILDRVILEINRAGMSPRLGEVASQLVAAINQSVSQIYTKEFDMSGLRLKKKMVELKEREVNIKEQLANMKSNTDSGGVVNQNLIVTDRETVLRLLRDSKSQIKLLETNNDVGKEGKGEYDAN